MRRTELLQPQWCSSRVLYTKTPQASAPRVLSLLSPSAARGAQGSLHAELRLWLTDTISRQDRPQLPATVQTSAPHQSPLWLHRQYWSITHLGCSARALLRWRLCCVMSLAGVRSPQGMSAHCQRWSAFRQMSVSAPFLYPMCFAMRGRAAPQPPGRAGIARGPGYSAVGYGSLTNSARLN